MNPHIYDTAADGYVTAVLTLYLGLPETPLRASTQDRRLARQLYEHGVTLQVVESAFLLASVRRLARPADVPALSPIRSLAYFQPVIEELLSNPEKLHGIPAAQTATNDRTEAGYQASRQRMITLW